MKRIGFIYEKIIDVENCRQAIINASKGKRSRGYVVKYMDNLDYYANELSKRLQTLTFTTPYRMKTIRDKCSNKERTIAIPKFYPDLCAQHAINLVLMPYIRRSSYYYSCANFKGRGIKRANKGTKRAMRYKYCLKTDIRKFYPSIDNEKLKDFLRTKIKDEKVLIMLDHLIDTTKGLPIGNYTSPQLADWYLQSVDRLIKEKAKVKVLVRYADDNAVGDNNKSRLRYAFRLQNKEYESKGLTMKPNYQLFTIHDKEKSQRIGKGRKIDFVGNCYSRTFVTTRKRTALSMMRDSRLIDKLIQRDEEVSFHLACGFMSKYAMFRHANNFGLKKKYATKHINELKEIIRRKSKCGSTVIQTQSLN